MKTLKVLFCTSEMSPFSKTGGLADVAGALPCALKECGVKVACVTPLYRLAAEHRKSIRDTGKTVTVGEESSRREFRIHETSFRNVPVYFLDSKDLFDRRGLYGENGTDYPDNGLRFALFARACLDLGGAVGFEPTIFHLHDWQTALLAVYLKRNPSGEARSVLTIHNLAYQGLFPPEILPRIGLDYDYFHWQRLEFYGKVNFLKGGLVYADAITTVSPTYAREIRTAEFGCGLEGVLTERQDRLTGILNGIDEEEWNPETDPHIPARYSKKDIRGKRSCRSALFAEAGLAPTRKPLFGIITRLAEQKGLDILLPVMETLLGEGFPFVVLGTGDPAYEKALTRLKETYPERLGLFLTFNTPLAHRIEAGSNMFLMPSRFEPCGLNQFYSMRYGTIPIVRATGGLADSVHPYSPEGLAQGRSTGFVFHSYDPDSLLRTVREAVALFADKKKWRRLIRNAMGRDFSWRKSAESYLELYRKLVET